MEKSISNRFYLDYNATSPLAKSVCDFLAKGEFCFGNPSSLHVEGKKSKFQINEVSEYLYSIFNLNKQNFEIIYHSGASEGINTFFKGIAFDHFKKGEKADFFFSEIDHACVVGLKDDLEALGHNVYFFRVNNQSEIENIEELIGFIKTSPSELKYLNYTFMNNETGVIWPLETALEIKSKTGAIVHVDAVQTIAKMKDWKNLLNELDAYTYSAHKFGGLKGIGFSFISKNVNFSPLITGGSQQNDKRAGTENIIGIQSIKIALCEVVRTENNSSLNEHKLRLKDIILDINPNIKFLASEAKNQNSNTLFFIVPNIKGQTLQMKFDMNGLSVSTGSACSSGIIKENRIVKALGYSSEDSLSCIRLSLPYDISKEDVELIESRLHKVLK